MGKVLCIYHANCADGLGAAWAVQKALGPEVEFVAAKYGQEAPSCPDRDVLIVDFSYPLPVLRAMAQEARSVLVLDHHKTAEEDLKSISSLISEKRPWGGKNSWLNKESWPEGMLELAAIFDLNRSGAGLAWDYLHPGTPRPRIIDLIEDRDLWQFKYGDESRAFHAVLASYDWSDLPGMFARIDDWVEFWGFNFKATLIKEGRAILRAHSQAVRIAVESSRRTIRIAGHVVPVANVPPSMASDAGHLLCEEVSALQTLDANQQDRQTYFSATYYDGADGKRHFSLRSLLEGGADVGQIAKRMAEHFKAMDRHFASMGAGYPMNEWAGGGHAHAAGFDAPLDWEEQ